MRKRFPMFGPGSLIGAMLGNTARDLRRRKDRRELKEDEQRWEDEGGNVRDQQTSRPADSRKTIRAGPLRMN